MHSETKKTEMLRHIIWTLFALLLCSGTAQGDDKELVCSFYEGSQGLVGHDNCLKYHKDGVLYVSPALLRKLPFEKKYATAYSEVHGWMYINREGRVLVEQVMTMDNGADYVQQGFVRFKRDGKCGYASLGKALTIPPRFDGCNPFSGKTAWVCNDCELVTENEHSFYRGGTSFCIDTKGRQLACKPAPSTSPRSRRLVTAD